jgi:deoxyribodipyrimidine photo-lyase
VPGCEETFELTTLVWFRNDLRVADNPALSEACERGRVIACFVVSGAQWQDHDVGERRLAFLGRSLNALTIELAELGIALTLIEAPRFVDVPRALLALANQSGAVRLAFNAEYPSNEHRRDEAVAAAMRANGIEVVRTHGGVTLPPGMIMTKKETPFSVYTPFKRRWLERLQRDQIRPLPAPPPQGKAVPAIHLDSLAGVSLELGSESWQAGEQVARNRLDEFVNDRIDQYDSERNFPGLDGTSSLSAHLSVGSISSNQCLHAASRLNCGRLRGRATDAWVDQIIWRDFYRHVVALFPHVSRGRAFRQSYDSIPWRDAPAELAAWQEGATGYPLVDAGMRQLRQTGWMHNRLRMVTAMFLTKHLLIDWRHGERYFMQQLVDGDFAANNGGWQWSASTGTDAAPYFRIFNPTTQGRRFDPCGTFTREMLPELTDLPDRYLFEPLSAGVEADYPAPIVEHKFARQRAIAAFRHNIANVNPRMATGPLSG